MIAYKDKLVDAKRAPGTIKKQLAALHALFEYAMHNDLSEAQPSGDRAHTGGEVEGA